MKSIFVRLKALFPNGERPPGELRWFLIQLQIARLITGVALCVAASVLAGHLGANSTERSSLAIAGLLYGMVGTPYAIDLVLSAAWRTSRPRLRTALLLLAVALLGGPTILGFVYMAVTASDKAPWHFRLWVFGLGVALVVASCRELMASKAFLQKPEEGQEA